MGYDPKRDRADEAVRDKTLPPQPGGNETPAEDKKDKTPPKTETPEEALRRSWAERRRVRSALPATRSCRRRSCRA